VAVAPEALVYRFISIALFAIEEKEIEVKREV
jgi:hypothetical protein